MYPPPTSTFPSKNSERGELITNVDLSTDFYFGPKSPQGKEATWIETVPGKGKKWIALIPPEAVETDWSYEFPSHLDYHARGLLYYAIISSVKNYGLE